MHIISYNGKLYNFNNVDDENNELFIKRCWFKVKNMYKTNDYAYLEKISLIWINYRYLNVSYPTNIMNELLSFDD